MRAIIWQHPMIFVVVVCGSAFIATIAILVLSYRGTPPND